MLFWVDLGVGGRKRINWRFILGVLVMIIGECSTTRLVDPKLDFKSDDQVDKYPDLAINHKLYNVRVIVDAARSKQPRNMDAEVFSELDSSASGGSGKNKKTVGIATNITIEVSDEEQGKTGGGSSSADEEVENASVPVFKGKPVDKDRNRPESKLYFDFASGSQETQPFPKTDDDSFRNINWFYFQPPSAGYWTTAKPRSEDNFIPYGIGHRPRPTPSPYPDYLRVKPCLCKFHDEPPQFDRPPSYHRSEEVYYSRGRSDFGGSSTGSSSSRGVDDKLDYPFHA